MDNRKVLFEKIDLKTKEWENQVRYLQAKARGFDGEGKAEFERHLERLSIKLKDIEKRTEEIKRLTSHVHKNLGEKILHQWVESLTIIDNAILKLKD